MKNLKLSALIAAILVLGVLFVACNDDEDMSPITLKDREPGDTAIRLIYPSNNEAGYGFTLQGGDGNYFVSSSNKEVITAEMISSVDFNVIPISVGEATVTVTDKSRNSFVVNVSVDYQTDNFVVVKHDIIVMGDDLTENEKKAIRETQLAEIPVKVDGGYKFIFTDRPNDKGKAIIYTDSYGNGGVETTFEYFKDVPGTLGYKVLVNGEKRIFVLGRYSPSTKDMVVPVALMEDVTEKVQKDYPKAEFVYTSQVIIGRSNLKFSF